MTAREKQWYEEEDKYLKRVRELILAELAGRSVRVYLFGSRAMGQASPGSDVDIALEGRTALEPEILSQIRSRLEKSAIPYKVDIVDLNVTSPELRKQVRRTGVLWKDWN